ncbi:MAG: orotate phosphoribosyltransferase, partial [Deltaproteobacteria bacterium]|nr:orotate phosphoribosyltransferase [Deltaproteobacteria bacterium]
RLLLDTGCVTLRPDQPFTWASGILSPIYCDSRLLMAHPDARRQVREAFIELFKEKAADCELVAGVATGAIPHAAWVAEKLNKPMVYIRGNAKEHGKQNQVEGKVELGARAVVIEDMVSTGGSSVAAVEALRNAGAKVDHCFAIFSYGFPEAVKKFEEIQCTLTSLTDFSTLLQVAKESKIIKAEQETLLKKFSADPWHWLDQ